MYVFIYVFIYIFMCLFIYVWVYVYICFVGINYYSKLFMMIVFYRLFVSFFLFSGIKFLFWIIFLGIIVFW